MNFRTILGISAYYHDSAAALIVDGQIIAAAQEERFTRIKNTSDFPKNAVEFCLRFAELSIEEVDAIVFYEKPFLKFERILENFYSVAPKGISPFLRFLPEWTQKKIFLKREIRSELKALYPTFPKNQKIYFSAHHLSHAASAFYPSPFENAAILTIDAVGEWATASIGTGNGSEIEILKEMYFPDSVGLLYSSFTYFLGFKVNSGEYKMMGFAPFGELESEETQGFIDIIRTELVTVFDDGSIRLNQRYFKYRSALKMIRTKKWEQLFGINIRTEEMPFNQRHANLAQAIQVVTEEIVLKMALFTKKLTGANKLCLAGGVVLNSVANGKLKALGLFEEIWVQPAAGDAGGALGAALAFYHAYNDREVNPNDAMQNGFLGPANSEESIRTFCQEHGIEFEYYEDKKRLATEIAEHLAQDEIIGWIQGRMEYGPRALGARSILAAPFKGEMQQKINQKIKFREDFRPFAPVMLVEEAERYFGIKSQNKYMQFVHSLKPEFRLDVPEGNSLLGLKGKLNHPRSKFQSVIHVDYSARIQTVESENHPLWELLHAFKSKTGEAILINTSFNRNGEPLVMGIAEAYDIFNKTEMSILVIDKFVIKK